MIVVNSKAGQRSNRLITVAHAMAKAIEEGVDLRLTTFDEYKKDYKCEVTWNGRVVIRKSIFWECVRIGIALCKRIGWKGILKGRVVSDWHFRNHDLVLKHAVEIRSFFTPRYGFKLDLIGRGKGNVVNIGIHVRRGDYKEYLGGRYYYDDMVFERNKRALENEFISRGKSVRFIEFPLGEAVKDQWLMSKCDFIFGPPSTFTIWASFMGNVPLGFIHSPEQVLHISDFKIAAGL